MFSPMSLVFIGIPRLRSGCLKRHRLRRFLRLPAFISTKVNCRNGVKIFHSATNSRVPERRCLDQLCVDLDWLFVRAVAIDIVSSKVRLSIGSPGQVDEGLLWRFGKDRLERGGRGGREDVMGEHGDYGRIVAFDFSLVRSACLPQSHWGNPILIVLLPINASVDKQYGFIANGPLPHLGVR